MAGEATVLPGLAPSPDPSRPRECLDSHGTYIYNTPNVSGESLETVWPSIYLWPYSLLPLDGAQSP